MVEQEASMSVAGWVPALLDQVSASFEVAEPEEILQWGFEIFGPSISVGTAFGVSGMVLLDMAHRVCPEVDIFYIDTGFFFPETYDLIARAEARLGRRFRRVTPGLTPKEQEESYGEALWKSDSDRCCAIRKVVPLGQALAGQECWVTGLRRDQSLTRKHTPVVSWNRKYSLVKLAPLANWTRKDIWRYVHEHNIPYNPLHDKNYPSIGCTHCTSSVNPGEELRAGRWSGSDKTECGLHS